MSIPNFPGLADGSEMARIWLGADIGIPRCDPSSSPGNIRKGAVHPQIPMGRIWLAGAIGIPSYEKSATQMRAIPIS